MDKNEEGGTAAISEDEVRAGVTGHNVRYVLAFGLVGVIAAFTAIGIYFGYDTLTEMISGALARDPAAVARELLPYVLILVIGAVTTVLLLALWSRVLGPSENASQTGMRLRVVLQFVIVCAALTVLYLSVH